MSEQIDIGGGRVWAKSPHVGWVEMPDGYNAEFVRRWEADYDVRVRALTVAEVERAERGLGPVETQEQRDEQHRRAWDVANGGASARLRPDLLDLTEVAGAALDYARAMAVQCEGRRIAVGAESPLGRLLLALDGAGLLEAGELERLMVEDGRVTFEQFEALRKSRST